MNAPQPPDLINGRQPMTQHTPGPWVLDEDDTDMVMVTTQARLAESLVEICAVQVDYSGHIGVEQEANARLIAAAPEMYQALKAFMTFFDKAMEGFPPGYDQRHGCDRDIAGLNDAWLKIGHFWDARDAIAKAEADNA